MASEKGLFAAEILKGITEGLTRGLEVRQQRELRQQEFAQNNRRLDIEEQRTLADDERLAKKAEREGIQQEIQNKLEAFKAGGKVNPETGEVEALPYDQLSEGKKSEIESKKELSELKAKKLDYDKALAETKAMTKSKDQSEKDVGSLRKELLGNQVSKDTFKIRTAYEKINTAANDPSPAGDLAIVFNTMKALDPQSTVRESEQASVENARGVPDYVRQKWNKVKEGETLTPDQRKDFLKLAKNTLDAQLKTQGGLNETYKKEAARKGIDSSRVVVDGLDKPKLSADQVTKLKSFIQSGDPKDPKVQKAQKVLSEQGIK